MTTEYSAIKSAMETNFMKRPLIVTRYDNGGDDDDTDNGYEYGDDN